LDPGPVPLDSTDVFLLSRVCWGVGSAFVFVGAFSTITHLTERSNRGRWIGYMRGGQTLGFPAGLVIGGVVSDLVGYGEAFIVAGVAGLFSAAVAILVIPDVAADVERKSSLWGIPRLVGDDIRILSVSAVNFGVRFLFAGILLSTIVLYAQQYHITIGILSGTGVSGVVMAVGVLGSGITTVLAGRYSDRLSNRAALAFPGLGFLAGGFATLALFPTLPVLLVGITLIGVGVGVTNPPLLALLGDLSPTAGVGKLGGVYNVFGDLGASLGPIIALPLVSGIGFRTGYLLCVGLVVVMGVLVAATLRGDTCSLSVVGEDV
jgi:MFS family permease